MIRLLPILVVLLLTGCGSRTQINYGAKRAVYVGSAQHMFEHIPPGVMRANANLKGYYDPRDGSITISEQLDKWETARVFAHELAHAADQQHYHDQWELLSMYQSPRFDFNFHKDTK